MEDSYRTQCTVDEETCLIDILDTVAPEEPSYMRHAYMRTGHGFVCCYSITSRASFEGVSAFRDQILQARNGIPFNVIMVLVGTKCDLESERQVSQCEGADLAESFGCLFMETSAKSRVNVELVFHELVRAINRERQHRTALTTSPSSKTRCRVA
eukprot:TRINITY_DN9117_c0_g1_i1.p1 TRINITY_DN9117_c0_g1~~TRINITY_DN9117_c0_g1_i1.p1  ORF type:complete len:176 (+),score=15.45 TRINITY_DN9117_c0_g1_i1:65-529(+)